MNLYILRKKLIVWNWKNNNVFYLIQENGAKKGWHICLCTVTHLTSFLRLEEYGTRVSGYFYLFAVIQSEKLRHELLEFNQDDQLKRGFNIFILCPDFPNVTESTVYDKYLLKKILI